MPSQTPPLNFVVDESGSGSKEKLVIQNSVRCSNYYYPCVNNLSPSSTLSTSIDQNIQHKIFIRPSHALPAGKYNIAGDCLFDKFVKLSNDRSSQSASANTIASTPSQGIDIFQQMLSSLMRFNDIIDNLKSA
ncbi:hypothetical protein QN277_026764 [Acacia crassicarpa]|uniref:Uncharacterized protein n=1 Tax=Acacia crassicarpa TaxID=499986 RepID=A0AAE1MI55_9FABA|nr:hypothetical protein QN277_026764 [Acacia crassicarpa]